ncbi:probable G-protein coupled receptor 139 [Carcharodon carcharias]|uniref:probable G-protein coupled receptor 139 n=1 Tax=Carcharodon carcharias TaxID=13397 RepID=UPI001B7F4B7C|nr:probable G-protein coupled receptor 139 [Carcharodon carcharias]
MAVTDLLVIITGVIVNRIGGFYLRSSFLFHTPLCCLSNALVYAARDCSVWLTVAFTFDRFVAICCPNLKRKYCTKDSATRVITIICSLCCLKNIPWYFVYEPLYIMNNVPWFCSIKLFFYSSPLWAAFHWIDRILTPSIPFVLILLFNSMTVGHILVASRVRRRLWVKSAVENQSDPEMENRRKSIVLLFTISGCFILLWMVYLVEFLYIRITNDYYFAGSNIDDPKFILQESGNVLQLLSCCTNTFIYTVTQSKFREELQNGFKILFRILAKVVQ